jgi:uncharacterized coiled-coil DUF342 family protein
MIMDERMEPEDIMMRNQHLAVDNESMRTEIEALQNKIKYLEERFSEVCKERDEFWDMFDKAREERDEARRIACDFSSALGTYLAKVRGWDGLKEDGK